MSPESIVAIIVVSLTGIVSVLNGFVPIFLDKRKSSRDKIIAELDRIDSATLDLLRELSNFRHWVIDDIEKAAGCTIQEAYTRLQFKHYAWERSIWLTLNNETHERVKKLRMEFEAVHTPDTLSNAEIGSKHISDLSNEILSITYPVVADIKPSIGKLDNFMDRLMSME